VDGGNASHSADFLEPRCCTGVGVATAGRPLHPPAPQAPVSPALHRGGSFSGVSSNSGSLAMVAAIVLASSLVMR
jgi:hypothetical protein